MLRNRIFTVIVIAVVPVAVIAAALGFFTVNDSHRTDVARLEAAVLAQNARAIGNFIDGQILTQTSVLVPGSGFSLSTSAQQFALSDRLRALPFLTSVSYLDPNGKEVVRLDRNHPNGYPASALTDLSAMPAFQAARAGNYYISPVSYSSAVPSVVFASPTKNDAGNIVAVFYGEANLDTLQTILDGVKMGDTGYLYLVDRQGLIVAGGGPAADARGTSSVASLPIVQTVLGGHDLQTAETQMSYASALGGAPVVAAAEYLPEYGWGLVAEWPTAEANAVMNQLLLRNALALSAVIAVIAIISFFLAAYVVRPIRKLQEGAARVEQGKFDEGVAIATGDELQALGDSFNRMVQGLKQLEQLKDEFVFIAAHELRTPVAAMKGYLSLILDGNAGAVTPETKAFIEKVIASDNRLAQLVNDLLEVARSQAGRLTIKVAPTDIVAPIRAVLDELKSLADEKNVKLVYEPKDGLPQALADGDRVKEVMVNLVGNAIKYMGGSGTVTVSHEVKDGTLVTRVADTGLGISAEAQKKLFEKFYRVQTDKTRDITGTGLGLFIVKQIIEKMNGTIQVASEEGKGTMFSFGLPVAGA